MHNSKGYAQWGRKKREQKITQFIGGGKVMVILSHHCAQFGLPLKKKKNHNDQQNSEMRKNTRKKNEAVSDMMCTFHESEQKTDKNVNTNGESSDKERKKERKTEKNRVLNSLLAKNEKK